MGDREVSPNAVGSGRFAPDRRTNMRGGAGHGRIVWVDQAKGLAILLVVLYHAVFFMNAAGWGWLPLTRANGALATFRMPLFFFASGLFFSRNLAKPVGFILLRRVLPMMWLYVVWSVIFALTFSVVPWIRDPEREPLAELPWILVRPATELWFLYALAIYFLLTWVLNRFLSDWLQLAVALAIALVAALVNLPIWAFDDMGRHFIVFVAAVHMGPIALRFAAGRTASVGLIAGLLWAGALIAREAAPAFLNEILALPLALFAVLAGVAFCARLGSSLIGRFLAFLGGRTLSVYVLHVLLLGALFAYLPAPAAVPWWLSLAVALGVTFVVTVITAWVHAAGMSVPGLLRAPWIPGPVRPGTVIRHASEGEQ